ncbi:MAG: hypothetical protein IPP74_04170 [Alphaproteobacteria bacterium]|nr:hypothetical protein [Alphaproteobacteria bacterium]
MRKGLSAEIKNHLLAELSVSFNVAGDLDKTLLNSLINLPLQERDAVLQKHLPEEAYQAIFSKLAQVCVEIDAMKNYDWHHSARRACSKLHLDWGHPMVIITMKNRAIH